MVNFPAPVGGTPLPLDFAPSIVFAVLYGLLFPLVVYRILSRRSRVLLLIGTGVFSIERIVIYALRASQTHDDSRRYSRGLTTYMQISFGMGYINIANDSVGFIRCLLVNATFGSDTYPNSPAGRTKGAVCLPPPENTPDQPKLRFWFRRLTDLLRYAFLASIVPSIIAQAHYSNVMDNQGKADSTATLRYVSTGVALAMCVILLLIIAWTVMKFPARAVSRRSAALASLNIVLMSIVAIYRLSIMNVRTTSLAAFSPLNRPGAKAEFYIFHALPEWLVMCILLSINARKTFSTGLAGDWRPVDKAKKSEKEDTQDVEKAKDDQAVEKATDNQAVEKKQPEEISTVNVVE